MSTPAQHLLWWCWVCLWTDQKFHSWGEGRGEKAYNCNWITIKNKLKKFILDWKGGESSSNIIRVSSLPKSILFSPWAAWFQLLPQVTLWSYCWCSEPLMAPSWGQGRCLTHLPLPEEGSQQPQRGPRMLFSIPSWLKCCEKGTGTALAPAPEAELGQVWREQ